MSDLTDTHYDDLIEAYEPHLVLGKEPYGFSEFLTGQKLIRALVRFTGGDIHPTRIEIWFRIYGENLREELPDLILPKSEREWELWYQQLSSLLPGFIRDEAKKAKKANTSKG
jgi:hypothetical protein